MDYIDLSYLGTGAGLVLAFWFFGLCVAVVFGVLRKVGLGG